MNQADEAALSKYPQGRGYGNDYMRGGEVFGGYGYADRDEYSRARGELASRDGSHGQRPDHPNSETRT